MVTRRFVLGTLLAACTAATAQESGTFPQKGVPVRIIVDLRADAKSVVVLDIMARALTS